MQSTGLTLWQVVIKRCKKKKHSYGTYGKEILPLSKENESEEKENKRGRNFMQTPRLQKYMHKKNLKGTTLNSFTLFAFSCAKLVSETKNIKKEKVKKVKK